MFDNENNEQQIDKETGFGRENETNNGQTGSSNELNSNSSYGQSNNTYEQKNNSYNHGNNTYGQNTYSQNNTYGNYGNPNNGSGYQQNGNNGNYSYNNQSTYGTYQYSYQPGMNGGNGPKKSGSGKKIAAAIAVAVVLCLALGAGYYSMTRISQIPASQKNEIAAANENQEEIKEDKAEEVTDANDSAKADDSAQESPQTSVFAGGNAGIAQTETAEGSRTVVTDVTEVVAKAMPAMVSINNNFTQAYNYFGQTYSQEQTASGSGIIVGTNDTELLIATNYHVIEGADSLEVQFADDNKAKAEVKGTDSNMDLAVIAVQLSDLSADTKNAIAIAVLGDSDALTLGEPAIAIGNALGYGQSVTTGVISAVNRVIDLSEDESGTKTGTFIQTNAAINPGNSGGALLNIRGEVIGINSNKIGGEAVEGMGYAIPISTARPIIEQLMTEKTRAKVAEDKRGYLGISGVSVTSDVSKMYGLPLGVYVAGVSEDGGAKAAGIQEGDIITKFDGKEISSMDDLQNRLAYYEAGETVTVTIQRQASGGYQDQEMQITLGSKQTVQSDADTDGEKYDGEPQPDAKPEEDQQDSYNPFENPFGFGFDFGN